MTSLPCGFGLNISGFSFESKPLVDRVAANPEQLTDLTPFHPIEFNRFDYFVTQVIVVSFGHRTRKNDGLLMIAS